MNLVARAPTAGSHFIVEIAEYDPRSGKLYEDVASGENEPLTVRLNFSRDNGPQVLVREPLPAGAYVISEIESKLSVSSGDPPYIHNDPVYGDPLLRLAALLTMAAISEATADTFSFVDENGRLFADAPTFEVQAGTVNYVGTLIIDGEKRVTKVEEYDNDGQWDGHSYYEKTDTRFIADYSFDSHALHQHSAALRLETYPVRDQPIAAFADRKFVIEDYPGQDIPRRVLPRAPNMVLRDPAQQPRDEQAAPVVRPTPVIHDTGQLATKSKSELQRMFLDGAITKDQYLTVSGRAQ